MSITKTLSIFSLIFIFSACRKNTGIENISKPVDLKNAISENIRIPFENTDTLLYDPDSSTLGGNSDKKLKNTYYVPRLDSSKYINMMMKNNKHVFFVPVKDSLLRHTTENIVVLRINGKLISNDSVYIIEQYRLGHQNINITKLFEYTGLWSCKTISTEIKRDKTD